MKTAGPLSERWQAAHSGAETWVPPPTPTVVIVPHPDDEVLMFGGLIAQQRMDGTDVTIVAVTDGEAVYPSLDGRDVAALRRREQFAALSHLGVERSEVVRLGLPDGRVAEVEDLLGDRLVDLVAGHGLVLAPWTGDHHSDHEAVGRAAAVATRRTGAALAHGLFWTWHHGAPERLTGGLMRRLVLDDVCWDRRRQAMLQHESQITGCIHEPLLGHSDLEPLTWDEEYYLAGRLG